MKKGARVNGIFSASMPTQLPSLLCWNQYMEDCIEALETSPWALPSDKLLCKHIRLQRATDEHSRKVFASHLFRPASSTSGPDTHEIIDSFRRQLAGREDFSLSNRSNGNVFNNLRRAIQRLIGVPWRDLGIIQLLYHSSNLYVFEAVAAIDRSADGVSSSLDGTQGAAPRRRRAAPLKTSLPVTECIESAYSVVSVFTSLDLPTIRCMPIIFLIRVIHAIIFLVKSNDGTRLIHIPRRTSPSKGDLRVEHQLDEMIEIMANWGSDWPACRLVQVLTTLRRQLRDNQNKVTATCDPSSRDSCASHEDQETQSSSPTFPQPSTPLRYQSIAQQDNNLRSADFSAHEGPSYGDPSSWEAFPQPSSHSYSWKAEQPQPQPHAILSEANFSSEYIPPTGLFAENSQHELQSFSNKMDANTTGTGNTSNLSDYMDPLLSMEDILTP